MFWTFHLPTAVRVTGSVQVQLIIEVLLPGLVA